MKVNICAFSPKYIHNLHVPDTILDIRNITEDIIYICVGKMYRCHIFNLLSVVTRKLEKKKEYIQFACCSSLLF